MGDLTEHLNAGTLKAIHTAKMTAASVVEGIKVLADPLHLDEIPGAMDKMGWEVSARLMRRWFATGPAYAMPSEIRAGRLGSNPIDYSALPASQVEDEIVKMKWLLGYATVSEAFKELSSNWCNSAAVDHLRKVVLPRAGWAPGKIVSIGHGLQNAKMLDSRAAINYKKFGEYLDTLNDLFGAIFRANLKVAVVGKTTRSWIRKQDTFEVEKLGFYMRDTYDFNPEPLADMVLGLGVWSRNRILTKLEMLDYRSASWAVRALKYPDFVPVHNADFRRWQTHKHTGGDCFVFSDVMWLEPNADHILL